MSLSVLKEDHKTEVHMQLLMAMEQCEARIVGDKLDFHVLISSEHCDVFHDAGGWSSSDTRDFEGVTVQVNRMDVVARVPQNESVTLAFL